MQELFVFTVRPTLFAVQCSAGRKSFGINFLDAKRLDKRRFGWAGTEFRQRTDFPSFLILCPLYYRLTDSF